MIVSIPDLCTLLTLLFIVIPIVGFCNCAMFCCTFHYVTSSFAIILIGKRVIGKRELVALHSLSSWCLVIVVWLFLAVPRVSLQFVIVVYPNHNHYFNLSNLFNWSNLSYSSHLICLNLLSYWANSTYLSHFSFS